MQKIIFPSFILLCFLVSCKKQAEIVSFSEATYRITVSGKWKMPEFAIPANVHFTILTGMLHNSGTYLFRPGSMATIGVERLAEDGNAIPLLAEVDTLVSKRKAAVPVVIYSMPYAGEAVTHFNANSSFPLFSCMSMIAPTPDWFIGLHDFNLFPDNKWISDTTLNVYVYDAGTEDGDIFGQSNPDSSPHQPVSLLTPAKATVLANGNAVLAPMATIRITKQ